jgi:hypothetical protein
MEEQFIEAGKWCAKKDEKCYFCRVRKERDIFKSWAVEKPYPDRPWEVKHALYAEGKTEGLAIENLLKKLIKKFEEGDYFPFKELTY